MTGDFLVEVHQLSKYFSIRQSMFKRESEYVKALDHVDLFIRTQETLGIVGESGCGKTTLGRIILNLLPPSSGRVLFDGRNLMEMERNEKKKIRRAMQIVFQNPYASFDPRFSIKRSLYEPLVTHTSMDRIEIEEHAKELLELVGMPGEVMYRYPHEFSGGQLQRIAVARALALDPRFVVLDEPTSALDVSVQAQILNLLRSLQERLALTYMLISHDLGVVLYLSERIAVMYLGKIVELLSTEELIVEGARHPYTQALLAAVPKLEVRKEWEYSALPKSVADPARPPAGCSFHPRCPVALEMCSFIEPSLLEISAGHHCACHLVSVS